MTEAARAPRTVVTTDAFRIDPALAGTPLASPWRRLVALGIDLAVVGILTILLADAKIFLWGAIGLLLLRVALHRTGRSMRQTSALLLRTSVGCLGVVILGVVLLVGGISRMSEGQREAAISEVIEAGAGLVQMGGVADTLAAANLSQASPEEAVAALERAAVLFRDAPIDREARAAILKESVPADAPWIVSADSLIEVALDRAGTATAEPPLTQAERDTLQKMERRVEDLTEQLASQRRTLASLLAEVWDQIGSAVGLWSLYFALLLPRMNGQTIGKRMTGVRVVRLDGQPITWWSAFERSGGYLAGLATGFLGFAQVFWDRNRQCIHDKIVETVVVTAEAQPRMKT